MGLGWLMEEWDGKRVIGHGGGTIGQLSFLQCLPDEGLVIALLTNSTGGGSLWRDLARWLFEELAGVHMAEPLKPPDSPPDLDLSRYAGTYERFGVRHVVTVEDGNSMLSSETTDELPPELRPASQPPPTRLRLIDRERFAARIERMDTVVAFLEFDRGVPGYLFAGRAARRTSRRTSTRPAPKTRSASKASASKTASPRR